MIRSISNLARPLGLASAALGCLLALQGAAQAQSNPPPSMLVDYPHDTGLVSNNGQLPAVVFSFPVHVQGAQWLRLHFSEVELAGNLFAGSGSILRITSLYDAAVQEQNEIHVGQWRKTSAYFNGDSVLVEVLAQPGTGANRVVLESVTVGLVPDQLESQCGPTDDRVASNDPRAGRQLPGGCTGWLINDCSSCALTAGHCTGSLGVLQFNVPLSNSNGSLNNPHPDDQYSLDPASLQSNGGQGVGNDWGYYGVFPNTNTGLTPFQAQGARFTLSVPPPFNPNEEIRITGYGTDTGTANQTQQTHKGPWVTFSGSTVQYQTDTTGGNSGSPVIHEQSGNAIGIHTHGGCTSTGGQNSGTGANHAGLQAALASPLGVCLAGSLASSVPSVVVPGQPTPLQIQVGGAIVPGSAMLHYRLNGGAFSSVVMVSLGGGVYQADLPAAACSDSPDFYFSANSTSCGPLTDPGNAPASFYSVVVGSATVVADYDFESAPGWSTLVLGATSGQWQRGVPVNDPSWAYDPLADSDGSGSCWLTQNQLGNTDVDNGAVQLVSASFDLSAGGALVSYDYYLNLTVVDGIDMLLVEANDGVTGWREVARHTSNNGTSWTTHSLTDADFTGAGLSLTASMVMRFTANDDGTQSIVEAGLDAFKASTLTCGDGNYCTAGTTVNGCQATLSAAGTPSVSAGSGFVVTANGVEGQKNGLLFYGINGRLAAPWGIGGTSFRCVRAPTQRTGLQGSGGTSGSCDGSLSLDWNAYFTANPAKAINQAIASGSVVDIQAWFRDPGSPRNTSLSDGYEFTVQP